MASSPASSTVESPKAATHSGKKPYFGWRGKALHRGILATAGLGFFLFGYDQGVMGGLLTLPSFVETFPRIDVVNTTGGAKSNASTMQGLTIGLYEIGCMIGALSTLYLGDKYGRRKLIWWGSAVMIIGAVIQTASYHLEQLIIARIVSGVGNGWITATVPVWQSECARAEHRGYLVMIEGALITGGVAFSYGIDLAFYFVPGAASWRVPIAFQIIFAIIIFCTVMSMPESPRWLIKKGRYDEARDIFAALEDVGPDDENVMLQVEEVRATLPLVESGSLKDIFSNAGKEKNFHRACLGFFNQMMQQISGINLVTYYAASLYETSIGLSPLNSKILAFANGVEYHLASWIAVFVIDRIGRRKLMIFGALGMSASMAVLCGTIYAATETDVVERGLGPINGLDNKPAGYVAAAVLFIYNTFFAIGWLGMTWLYPAEITPLRIRAPANGLSTASNWIFNFLIVMLTPIMFDSIGFYTYAIFAGINFLIAVTVYILYPETAKRSLESIDLIFEQSNPKTPWDVVGIAKRLPYDSHVTDDENGVHLSAEAKYALKVRERKGYTASEKGAAEHYEHQDAPSRRFDDGAPTKE